MPARSLLRLSPVACLLALLLACSAALAEKPAPLDLSSPSFSGTIPDRFASCDGQTGNSPALAWSAPPASTRSFALLVTDPDAPMGPFTHWTLWNVPPQTRSLPGSVPAEPQLPSGARQGRNDFGHIGYGGPCPPGHAAHRYVFELYAVDTKLTLSPGASKKNLLDALRGHVLAAGRLIGRYAR